MAFRRKFPQLPDMAAFDPNRFVKFSNPLHHKRVAAILGIGLGVSFFTCFFTGLVSHFMQHPVSWYSWSPRPAGLYRVTQGLHVVSGLIAVPLLLAKLWTIFPKLFEFPPVRNFSHALERLSLFPLIGGSLFQLVTGIANINQWYFFKFFFTNAHYAVAWITIGALIIHIGAKTAVAREALRRTGDETVEEVNDRLTRRRFLYGTFGTAGLVTAFSVGQTFTPLGRIALLAPRRPGVGPQCLPINKSAESAGVIAKATSADYRLTVQGRAPTPLTLTLDEMRALPQYSAALPITCVEGWSASAHWQGIRVRDLLKQAGAAPGSSVRVESIEEHGLYGQTVLNAEYAADPDTLLALRLNGSELHIEHGFPCRLIAPNRPGVLQTKWVTRLVVL